MEHEQQGDGDGYDYGYGGESDAFSPLPFTEMLADCLKPTTDASPLATRLATVSSALVEVDAASPMKLYASVVAALERTIAKTEQDDPLTPLALLELLRRAVPYLPPHALAATLSVASRALRGTVEDPSDVVRDAACKSASAVLRRLPATSAQIKPIGQLLVGTLFREFYQSRPAQHQLCELLVVANPKPACYKIIQSYITKFLRAELKRALGSARMNVENSTILLTFLKTCVLYTDFESIGADLMETTLALMKLLSSPSSDARSEYMTQTKQNTISQLNTLGNLLATIASILDGERGSPMSPEESASITKFATRVLASLIQAAPASAFRYDDDTEEIALLHNCRVACGSLIASACRCVLADDKADKKTVSALLPLAVETTVKLSTPPALRPDDATVAESLMAGLTELFRTTFQAKTHLAQQCLKGMEPILLNPALQPTWTVSLKALVALLHIMNGDESILEPYARRLIVLREKAKGDKASEHALAGAVLSLAQDVGVETFWQWTALKPSNDAGEILESSWLIPVMKGASMTSSSQLTFFRDNVLGLARVCDTASVQQPSAALKFRPIVVDLWSLLEGFCTKPNDIPDAFPSLAGIFARAVKDDRYPQLVSIVSKSLARLASGVRERLMANAELVDDPETQEYQKDADTISQLCSKLLPTCFRMMDSLYAALEKDGASPMSVEGEVEEITSTSNRALQFGYTYDVTSAISSLVRLAPSELVQQMFKKVVHRLLEALQADGDETSAKIMSLMNLAHAILLSECLDNDSVFLLYRSLRPVMLSDATAPRVQKRAYKLLADILEQYNAFFVVSERLSDVCELLTSSVVASRFSSRRTRLKSIRSIIKGFDTSNSAHMEAIPPLLAEVLVCMKDANHKSRDVAYDVLMQLAEAKGNIEQFTHLVIAALGAETTLMRSAAVIALSKLVFEHGRTDESLHQMLPVLLETVMVLLNDDSREVIKSVVGFIRVCVVIIPAETMEPLVPQMVSGLLLNHNAKTRFKPKVKLILSKLVAIYGYDLIYESVPTGDRNLINHLKKTERRRARSDSQTQTMAGDEQTQHEFGALMGGDNTTVGDQFTFVSAWSRATARTGKTGVSRRSRATSAPSVRIKNDAKGDVYDMADLIVKQDDSDSDSDDSDSDDESIGFDDATGKLVIKDVKKVVKKNDQSSVFQSALTSAKSVASTKKTQKKRGRDLGSAYRSKKAGGDVKRKGQRYEPYAFVPLDGRSYSKKHRANAVQQMSSVVQRRTKRQKR